MPMNQASREVFEAHFAGVSVETEGGVIDRPMVHVQPVWSGVDRPLVGGWGLRVGDPLIDRLVKAIEAGEAFVSCSLRTDVNGKTYVEASHAVIGRTMNAGLRRLGF